MTIIERAFEIAPQCGSIDELKRRLTQEGYSNVNAHFAGRQLKAQLSGLLNTRLRPQQ